MVDFSRIFNILFVSVCAALLLFLLISVIAVAAKGKRKCGAFDIALRIISVIVLIVSAAMLMCAVLTMLTTVDGSVCIVATQEGDVAKAWLAMGGEITELPMPELFVALSTVIGFGLSAVLFILSLAALIVDCLVANKKTDKKSKKEPAVQKTPEQLKREAELERIRKIGESAVRKTSNVANAEKTDKSEKTEKQETTEQTVQSAAADSAYGDFDWRTAPAPDEQEQTGFVGIKDSNDDSFDSFDSFDDIADEGAGNAPDAQDEYADEHTELAEEQEEYDEFVEEQEQPADDMTDSAEQEDSEQIYYDDDEAYTVDDGATSDEVYDENAEQEVSADDEYYEQAEGDDEQVYDEQVELEDGEDGADYVEEEAEPDEVVNEHVEKPAQFTEPVAATRASDIAPDRGIYIPEIRTVTPRSNSVSASAVKKPSAPTAKKTTPKKAASKIAKPKKSGGAAQKREVATNIPPEKKLPVTRRYVILDRHNAVNMFGEYLKERNQAEKDKLKSSINTIIIE